MADLISAGWDIAVTGYEWVECSTPVPSDIDYAQDKEIFDAGLYLVPKMNEQTQYRQIQNPPNDLFQSFGRLETTKEAIIRFANSFGNLGGNTQGWLWIPGPDAEYLEKGKTAKGTSLAGWYREIASMRIALDLWASVNSKETGSIHKYFLRIGRIPAQNWETGGYYHYMFYAPVLKADTSPASIADVSADISHVKPNTILRAAKQNLVNIINHRLSGNLKPILDYNYDSQKVNFKISANSLISLIWLQFAQALSQGKAYKECEACGKWVDVSNKLGARVDKKWCSETCKKRMYRKRLSEKTEPNGKNV